MRESEPACRAARAACTEWAGPGAEVGEDALLMGVWAADVGVGEGEGWGGGT